MATEIGRACLSRTVHERRPLFPIFASITNQSSDARSTYHALQISLTRRLARGFSILSNYTWSRLLDAGVDLGLVKNVRLRRGHAVQFRAGVLQPVQPRNLGNPVACVSAPNFGQIVSAGSRFGGSCVRARAALESLARIAEGDHMSATNSRREFFGLAAGALAAVSPFAKRAMGPTAADKPALLGGIPVHKGSWPRWPEWRQAWEPSVLQVLRSGQWYRGSGEQVPRFEAAYAELLGAKRCLATASGTTALIVGMHVLDVDAGDEVIVSPFTFSASYNAILFHKALPVFADTDPATLTLDAASIESRITERTRAVMPVHIYGMPCDMDPIVAVARKHRLAVIEDACQAWLADYKGKKCGTIGDLGCFSFQNSKHLPAGEGGAITGNSDDLIDRASSFHDCGRPYGGYKPAPNSTRGGNFRMQHFQAAMLLQQFDKLRDETARRRENAARLSAALKEIPGIQPARLPANSHAVWHLYPFRYDAEKFQGLPREQFIKAMRAEGIPCSTGYREQYFDGLLDEAIGSRGFKRLFSERRLKEFRDSFQDLKGNRQVCATTVAITQNLLLADPADIDHIGEAIRKIQAHGAALAKS